MTGVKHYDDARRLNGDPGPALGNMADSTSNVDTDKTGIVTGVAGEGKTRTRSQLLPILENEAPLTGEDLEERKGNNDIHGHLDVRESVNETSSTSTVPKRFLPEMIDAENVNSKDDTENYEVEGKDQYSERNQDKVVDKESMLSLQNLKMYVQRAKILVASYQVLLQMPRTTKVDFPPAFNSLLKALSILNLDFVAFVPLGCTRRFNFIDQLYANVRLCLLLFIFTG